MRGCAAAAVYGDFSVIPLEPKLFYVELPNVQYMFISAKASLGILLASF